MNSDNVIHIATPATPPSADVSLRAMAVEKLEELFREWPGLDAETKAQGRQAVAVLEAEHPDMGPIIAALFAVLDDLDAPT